MRGGKMIDGVRCYVARPEGMTLWQAWKARRKERKENRKKMAEAERIKREKLTRTKVIDGKRYYLGHEESGPTDWWWKGR